MRPLFGPRTVVEAAFIVAVPVIALEVGLHIWGIVLSGAAAYVLVVLVELGHWYQSRQEPLAAAAAVPEAVVDEQHVRVIRAEPVPEPEPAREPPRLAPEPLPEPEPGPEPELPPAGAVIRIDGPRQWNVWDLERVAREHSRGDPIADEERTFLLMYLRDFAGPDGLLPVDFDGLVRQSFGRLVANL
jgi:hypothetical protein